jgi:RNA polymerase sigma-70 factor (ECF subfamily)
VSAPRHSRALFFPIIYGSDRTPSVTQQQAQVASCPSDEDVMARLRANDSNSLNFLFDRYARLALRIAIGILHDYSEAEEVVQDAFFQVFKKAALFDPSKGTAKAWIVQIAFRRALDRKRYLDRRGFYLGTDIGCLEDSLIGETDLDREIEGNFNRTQLEKAFKELPERQRQTLELFYFAGLELREIVEKLDEPLGNVRHHFYRGLERLRESTFVRSMREK